ncbi:MAG: lysine--tRNA ligase [Actinobacteria bacterium]|nr:lysine--tRNA ligase [Actinomycetota bacterium]
MPAPKRFPDRGEIAAVRVEIEPLESGSELAEVRRLAGRVLARRELGKLVFLDLVDRSGRIQLLCDTSRTGAVEVRLGDVVGVTGKPAKSRRGEPSLAVDSLEVLASNRSPLPDTFHGLTDVETRYRKRHLDLLMNEESRELFLLRARIVTAVRGYLDAEGFVEVETPVLQPRYGGAFAHPFVTHSKELDADLYLRIATELYLKRLIVGGLERVYEIGKDFRNESISYKHQPEFTMLEWYEAYADYSDTMERIETMVERVALEVLGATVVMFRGHEVDLKRPWRRLGFVESLEELELWTRDEQELRAWLTERGVDTDADRDWTQLIDHAFSHFVEPSLIEPSIVFGHPTELSPFARTMEEDPSLAERFEFFAAGLELGNAYSEINDAETQQRRFDEQLERTEGVPGDPDYVEALSYGMPPTSGLGLGIDRLAMLLSGSETIRDVILFPALRTQGQIL